MIRNYPTAFEFASDNLKNDVNFVLKLVEEEKRRDEALGVKQISVALTYAADWIQAIVGDGDPVEMLKDYIEKRALKDSITKETSEKEANAKRRKGGI